MAFLLSSFLKGFHELFLTALILLTCSESEKELPVCKMLPNEPFMSEDEVFFTVAALKYSLSTDIKNRAVSMTGMKLLYRLHRSCSSAYTVYYYIQ